jgi:hypothetical protein
MPRFINLKAGDKFIIPPNNEPLMKLFLPVRVRMGGDTEYDAVVLRTGMPEIVSGDTVVKIYP